jgi:hypothetical protein
MYNYYVGISRYNVGPSQSPRVTLSTDLLFCPNIRTSHAKKATGSLQRRCVWRVYITRGDAPSRPYNGNDDWKDVAPVERFREGVEDISLARSERVFVHAEEMPEHMDVNWYELDLGSIRGSGRRIYSVENRKADAVWICLTQTEWI